MEPANAQDKPTQTQNTILLASDQHTPIQSQTTILLCKPATFQFNDQTAKTNPYQTEDKCTPQKQIRKNAISEWEQLRDTLQENGIEVITYEDTEVPKKPDAVFCRDWNSFHASGLVILYPLRCENRRIERRIDVIEKLTEKFEIKEIFSLINEEESGKFLEGSGAIVFDHVHKRMYVCRSERTNDELVDKVAKKLGFTAFVFEALGQEDKPVYHADVVMTVGTQWAILCEESFINPKNLEEIKKSLDETGHEIIAISKDQMNHFAANCYEAANKSGDKFLVISQTAHESLNANQIQVLERYVKKILPININTIEQNGGGSIRCMSGDIRLPRKTQAMSHIMMCRPAAFGYNEQTAEDNVFQNKGKKTQEKIHEQALKEFDNFVEQLQKQQISVIVYYDNIYPLKPDAIFCNNWGTFHDCDGGSAILYPMKTPNRRIERRTDVYDMLCKTYDFQIKSIIDLSRAENFNEFLEGSGSMNFDHINKIIYASISQRTNESLIKKVGKYLGYETVIFRCVDKEGKDIYHVNVVMALGDCWAVLCEESIKNSEELELVRGKLTRTEKKIIPISLDQVKNFAGNCFEACNKQGAKFFVISETGWKTLDENQKNEIKKYATPLVVPLSTIEFSGGGGVRCLATDVRLPKKMPN